LPAADRNWGGRRQSLLTPEEEVAFLKPWLESAATGNLVVVSPIRAALAQRLGQPIKPSVVYRLLARHGWRKVAPDTRHPKNKPEVQEAWKKTP
jgi:transposase